MLNQLSIKEPETDPSLESTAAVVAGDAYSLATATVAETGRPRERSRSAAPTAHKSLKVVLQGFEWLTRQQ